MGQALLLAVRVARETRCSMRLPVVYAGGVEVAHAAPWWVVGKHGRGVRPLSAH